MAAAAAASSSASASAAPSPSATPATAAVSALHVDMDKPQPVRAHDVPNETGLELALEWLINQNLLERAGPPKKPAAVDASEWVISELLPKLASHTPAAVAVPVVSPPLPPPSQSK